MLVKKDKTTDKKNSKPDPPSNSTAPLHGHTQPFDTSQLTAMYNSFAHQNIPNQQPNQQQH